MNLSSLPIYYSKENLTNRFVDYSNVFLLPSICYFGVVTSLICVTVTFKRDEAHAKSLDFIFLNSSIDFLFLIIQSFLFIFRCGALCPYGYTYSSKIYEIYIYLYVGYVLITSQVFLNIYISYDRLKMFSAKKTTQKSFRIFKVYAVCAVISILANAPPYIVSKEVVAFAVYMPEQNMTSFDILYKTVFRKELDEHIFHQIMMAITVIKDPVMFCILCLSSILVCIKYRAHFKVRRNLIKTPFTGR